tara:strand:+ start:8113 stop:8898 length:786 start_codon:yes stop_codon:yes gene_type:complete
MSEAISLWSQWINGPLDPYSTVFLDLPLFAWARIAIAFQVFAIVALVLELLPSQKLLGVAQVCHDLGSQFRFRPRVWKDFIKFDWFMCLASIKFIVASPWGEIEPESYDELGYYLGHAGSERERPKHLGRRSTLYTDFYEGVATGLLGLVFGLHLLGLAIALIAVLFSDDTFSALYQEQFGDLKNTGLLFLAWIFRLRIMAGINVLATFLSPLWLIIFCLVDFLILRRLAAMKNVKRFKRGVTLILAISGTTALFLSLLTS